MTQYGFRRYFKVGPIAIDRVRSWDHPKYSRFGFWFRYGGFTARFKDWLVLFR